MCDVWLGREGAVTPMDLIVTGADALQCLQQVGRTLIKGAEFAKHTGSSTWCSLLYNQRINNPFCRALGGEPYIGIHSSFIPLATSWLGSFRQITSPFGMCLSFYGRSPLESLTFGFEKCLFGCEL